MSKRRYWLYAPGRQAKFWNEFYDKGVMGLGWNKLGDLRRYTTKEEIVAKLQEIEKTNSSKKNDATANYDFAHTISEGDVVIAKKGRKEYLGFGIVTSAYYYDKTHPEHHSFRKVNWIKKGNWADENASINIKTLTDITSDTNYISKLEVLLDMTEGNDQYLETPKLHHSLNTILYGPPGTGKTYCLQKEYFPKYISTEDSVTVEQYFTQLVEGLSWWQVIGISLLEKNNVPVSEIIANRWVRKKVELSESKTVRATIWGSLQMHTVMESETVNVKLRQPPYIFDKNSDKTWRILEEEARETTPELFEHLDSVKNFTPSADKIIKRFEFVTFHQSYSYEDFIEGIKPVMLTEGQEKGEISYEIKSGIFKEICKRAENDPEHEYALFIDEINRGNVSQIFGELITLIEDDKRKGAKNAVSVVLPYSRNTFSVPKNLHIIGAMNTADRSVEALDTALRRRFSFVEMLPRPDLIKTEGKAPGGMVQSIDICVLLETMNRRIEKLLDKDHMIGHSYFLPVETLNDLKTVFQNKIIPLLQEYFFGDYGKIGLVLGAGFFAKEQAQVEDNFFAHFDDYDYNSLLDRKVYHLKNVLEMQDEDFKNAIGQLLRSPMN